MSVPILHRVLRERKGDDVDDVSESTTLKILMMISQGNVIQCTYWVFIQGQSTPNLTVSKRECKWTLLLSLIEKLLAVANREVFVLDQLKNYPDVRKPGGFA